MQFGITHPGHQPVSLALSTVSRITTATACHYSWWLYDEHGSRYSLRKLPYTREKIWSMNQTIRKWSWFWSRFIICLIFLFKIILHTKISVINSNLNVNLILYLFLEDVSALASILAIVIQYFILFFFFK